MSAPEYEVGLAHEGSATPQVYLLLLPLNKLHVMSPAEARKMADLTRARARASSEPEELLSLAATLDELAAEVESGAWRGA
jgi:hypothetical protein